MARPFARPFEHRTIVLQANQNADRRALSGAKKSSGGNLLPARKSGGVDDELDELTDGPTIAERMNNELGLDLGFQFERPQLAEEAREEIDDTVRREKPKLPPGAIEETASVDEDLRD